MNPIDWLYANAHGFSDLSEEEQNAIMHFSLLWSYFEAQALNNNASASAILTVSHEWASDGRLSADLFDSYLSYFQNRYFKLDEETQHFEGLNLRKNDSEGLVRLVLKGENANPADRVAVLLIIIFRLRNNLFHGSKWAYGIRGQLDNFKNANESLMTALETNSRVVSSVTKF
jgi:hypothetical protein